jgi:ATP-dependent Lon protease
VRVIRGNALEIEALRKAIADAQMPEEVANQANKELKRLERMSDGSAEYSMLRAYLDWLVELPWQEPEPDRIEIADARRILDADHFGLDQIKKRIIEFLAVRKLNPSGHGPILCFVGPPGVGKTSLGQSIAKALWGASSCAPRSAAFTTRPKFAAIDAPISAPCPATSFRRSARPDRGAA